MARLLSIYEPVRLEEKRAIQRSGAHTVSLLVQTRRGPPYTVLKKALHIHPTVSELIPTILAELQPI